MRLLDLFCCEGGASEGYRRAGFDVYGIDLFVDYSQKRYPFPSYKGDAILALVRLLAGRGKSLGDLALDGLTGGVLPIVDSDQVGKVTDGFWAECDLHGHTMPAKSRAHLTSSMSQSDNDGRLPFARKDGTVEWLGLDDFDAIAGSPPCQAYSITKHSHNKEHPDLLAPVRYLFEQTGLPYVIENVPGAPMDSPLTLCGTEFNLVTDDDDGRPLHLKRHRLFESNVFLLGNGGCQCREFKRRGIGVGGVYGGGSVDRQHAKEVRRGGYTPGKHVRAALIGCDWMTLHGLSQSIPPAYTEHIGRQLIAHIESEAAA